MIIVEGPDGAGKTTLIGDLSRILGIPIAPRVVSQQTAAMVDLKSWVEDNVKKGFRSDFLFDRHRLISDPIYGSIIPSRTMDPRLYELDWYYKYFFLFAQCRPLVIFCLPSLDVVRANVQHDPDNETIAPHIDKIYYSYVARASELSANEAFTTILHDYSTSEKEPATARLAYIIQRYIRNRANLARPMKGNSRAQ